MPKRLRSATKSTAPLEASKENHPRTLTNIAASSSSNGNVNESSTQVIKMNEKMLLQSFYGDTRRLFIDAWIDRYGMLAKRKGFSEDVLMIEFGSYLVYEGLEWYMSVM